jgi:hypothetical protein
MDRPVGSGWHWILSILGCAALVALLVLTASESAGALSLTSRYGARYLEYGNTPPCCDGDQLWGTSASINVSSIAADGPYCILFRSDAENSSSYLIQAGIVRCGDTSTGLDQTCSVAPSHPIVKFVETHIPGSNYHCVAHGTASLGVDHAAVVYAPSGTTWYSFIDGIQYETNSFTQHAVMESGEHAGSDSCSGWTASATFAAGVSYPWQRFVQPGTWKTVQSSYNSPGCWTITGGPPGAFTIRH